ncbi:glycosyltransferase family 2 protein [Streptococcus sp. 19428wC2_LYSM12]|uniref:glycosyltransferase family 2 protein n=1 Tax=unclassified Streptococcus TaxID=2608887 RepID=UPI001071A1A5|nr:MULTISPECIES: glycosyltransferase family 2 protein [unclassified Streptococcus]MBF0786587.1 glycosyltransferase family 2 protein [Streptococcus sp. 19428wC2_LYSM12]TFV06550.1 glycosyltransferase family 2 protein [Streptococcus sp. LYSM12]
MKVNIVLSTYNGEQFLAQQIESIQAQTFTDWNLLIRDDGSTDGTTDVIRQFMAKDERIRWINEEHIENLGVIKSFHALVQYEEADVYFFSDQDDIWLPEKLQLALDEADLYLPEVPLMIYTDLKVVDQNLQVVQESMIRSQSDHANTELVEELTENTVTGGVSMVNHALVQLWNETDAILMHDWYLALLASAFGKLVYIDVATELYRQHGNNVLGARTWSKRMYKWLRPYLLFSMYWELIKGSQAQASHLLALPLTKEKKELVQAFVTIMEKPMLERYKILKKYGLRKNKRFHTLVFTILIVTKFAYKE